MSAGLILVAMATLHLFGNRGENILQPVDPLLGISSRSVFFGLAVLELAAAFVCLFARQLKIQMLCVLWLSSNLLLYRLALLYYGVKTLKAYYETTAFNFGISVNALNILMATGVGYLWFGSLLLHLSLRVESRKTQVAHGIKQSRTKIVNP